MRGNCFGPIGVATNSSTASSVSSGNILTAFLKGVMRTEFEARARRSQRDYSLPFKLTVVGEVGRDELSHYQTQRRYGIQGRSTVPT